MVPYTKLICILTSTMLTNMCLVLIVPFYPILAKQRRISEMTVGLIFTASPLMSCVSSYFVGKNIDKLGKKFTGIIGIILNAVSMMGLAFCELIENNDIFILMSLASRIFGGIGFSCIYIACLSTIYSDFSEKSNSFTSMMEAFGGLGLILSPVYVSVLYTSIGASGLLFCLSVFLLLFLPWFCFFFKPSVSSILDENISVIPTKFNRNFYLDFALVTFCYCAFTFPEPVISVYLEEKGMSEDFIALVFMGLNLSYTSTNFIMAWVFQYLDPVKFVNLSVMISISSLLITGPISFLFEDLTVTVFGVILAGVGSAMAFVTILPSMLSEAKLNQMESNEDLCKVSSFFSIGMNCGEILGPITAGFLAEYFSFKESCTLMAAVGLFIIAIKLKFKKKTLTRAESEMNEKCLDTKEIDD